jgi:ankyrin repeat protein
MASTSDALFEAISEADVGRVRSLLADDPSLATARDGQGVSALMQARYRFDRGLAQAVREYVTELDTFEAAAFGDVDRVTTLVEADPSAVTARSGDGFTALHFAAFFGQDDVVALLLSRGAEVDVRGEGWMIGTPLHSAAAGGHLEAARRLLDAGADPDARQSQGFAALHSAAERGDAALTRLLLAHGADVRATTLDGLDVRALAEASGDAETIEAVRQATA